MTISSRNLHDEISNLLDYLFEAEIALLLQPVMHDVNFERARVSWCPNRRDADFMVDRDRVHSIESYKAWVEAGAFSAMLFDGALLQITFEIVGGAVVSHRLAYVPCPFDVDPEWLRSEAALDLVDAYAEEGANRVELRSAVRFDYDPKAAKEGHPASHMTLNSVHCRIACAAPLRLGHFVDFVFSNFYPDLWEVHPYLQGLTASDYGARTLTEDESRRPHMNWRAAMA